jgi:hypothetical protein
MEPDDLLCSRNARPAKALVGRAQWKINQAPSLEKKRASLGGALCRSMRAVLGSEPPSQAHVIEAANFNRQVLSRLPLPTD